MVPGGQEGFFNSQVPEAEQRMFVKLQLHGYFTVEIALSIFAWMHNFGVTFYDNLVPLRMSELTELVSTAYLMSPGCIGFQSQAQRLLNHL